ncbi:MAG TPA: alpha/beta hydrolase [Acidimicrobiales bacterium]
MPTIRVRDLDVYYEIHGRGPRVLFISGTGAALRRDKSGLHSPLTEHFEVLLFDQRGLGDTSKPDVPYTMADYADDAAALLDALGWQRCHVVGVSFGGMVAQNLVVRHPDRVDRLVLACTSPGGEGGSSYDLRRLEGLSPEERARRSLTLVDDRVDLGTDPPTLPPGLAPILESLASYSLAPDDPVAAMGARRQLEARAGHDVWDDLPRVGSPTLIIGGRHDGIAPPENLARMASRIPGARLVLCDGGHVFLMQDPSAWPTIIDFLRDAR